MEKPIPVPKGNLTWAEIEPIIAHNEKGEKLCGWKPFQK